MSGHAELAGQRDSREALITWNQRLFESFRYQGFRRFWTASVTAQTTFRMGDVVLAWTILEMTSALYVGLLAFSTGIPMLLLSPLAGLLADRVKRQHILLAAMAVGAVGLAVLAFLHARGHMQPWHILVVAFAKGSAFTFYSPARLTLMPHLVPRKSLLKASTVEYASARLAGFIGPVVAGLTLGWLGMGRSLLMQALLLSMAGLVFVLIRTDSGLPGAGSTATSSGLQFISGMREAGRYLRDHDRPLLMLMALNLVMVPFGMSYLKLVPVFVREVLGGGPEMLGLLLGITNLAAAVAAVGMGAGPELARKGKVSWVTSTVFGFLLIIFAGTTSPVTATLLLIMLGCLSGVHLTVVHVLFHSRAPASLRGRVMSFISMVWGVAPFAHLGAGALADKMGVVVALSLAGCLCGVMSIGFGLVGGRQLNRL